MWTNLLAGVAVPVWRWFWGDSGELSIKLSLLDMVIELEESTDCSLKVVLPPRLSSDNLHDLFLIWLPEGLITADTVFVVVSRLVDVATFCIVGMEIVTVDDVAVLDSTLVQLRFAVGALDGLRRHPVVSFVWAARISGAINAMSGKEFGPLLLELTVELVSPVMELRNWRRRRIDARSHGKVPELQN